MIAERAASVNRIFGVRRAMRLLGRSRSSVYWARSRRKVLPGPGHKRGPKTEYTDAELTEQIRTVLGVTPFVGEGHRKVWARLRHQGVRTSKQRTLRLIRQRSALSTSALQEGYADQAHMTRTIKRITGLTPRAWSNLALSDVGASYAHATRDELITI